MNKLEKLIRQEIKKQRDIGSFYSFKKAKELEDLLEKSK